MQPLTLRWPLELDDVALWVRDVDGGPLSLCPIAQGDRTGLDAVCLEMATKARLIKWVYPKAEMIQVASFLSGCCAACPAEFAIDGHEIEDGSARSQLNQADLVLASLDRTSENPTVEAKHAVEVDNTQYKMVDFANADH
jgi:hypothetical protein